MQFLSPRTQGFYFCLGPDWAKGRNFSIVMSTSSLQIVGWFTRCIHKMVTGTSISCPTTLASSSQRNKALIGLSLLRCQFLGWGWGMGETITESRVMAYCDCIGVDHNHAHMPRRNSFNRLGYFNSFPFRVTCVYEIPHSFMWPCFDMIAP